jgi:hydroxymethylbilane synthase
LRRSRKPVIIAARPSPLARAQAELVGKALGRIHKNVNVEYRWITSKGDESQSGADVAGTGKGVFTRAIEKALLAGEADVAVHSLKDLPAVDTPGLQIAAVPRRAEVRDCLVSAEPAPNIAALASGAVVGTSSARRAAQLLALRTDLRIEPIRGNVETRLKKVLEATQQRRYDATLLAVAGLERLGLSQHCQQIIAPEDVLPAAGQGALAIQCRSDDHLSLTRCLPLNQPSTAAAVHAERQVVAGLGADCHGAIAILVRQASDPDRAAGRGAGGRVAADPLFRLQVRVMSQDGQHRLEADERAPARELRRLVQRVVADLQRHGAESLLAQAPVHSAAYAAS